MPKQTRKQKTSTEKTTETPQELPQGKSSESEKAEALKKEMDDLLDEIEGVLEENAEEFISSYIQKGGE